MKRIFGLFVLSSLFIISACSPQPAPAATPTPKPTTTPTPQPFTGRLFFDMNGSGLQDESSFVYDKERLEDPRQPLQPDLDKSIKAYVAAHPNSKNGDLVTIPEPGLSGYKVCIDQECATTTLDGSFSIPNSTQSTTALLKITDPYADKPALAMRYFNEWKGEVFVPTYVTNGVIILDQNLNDTKVIPIIYGFDINSRKEFEIGLMQGYLTYPYSSEESLLIQVIQGFDHDGRIGHVIDYLGNTTLTSTIYKSGTSDAHIGWDFGLPIKSFVLSMNEGSFDEWQSKTGNGISINSSVRTSLTFQKDEHPPTTVYGHLYNSLVKKGQQIYRGQVIGLSGMSGTKWAHLHIDFLNGKSNPVDQDDYIPGGYQKDPYAVVDSNVSVNFPEIEIFSYWTVFNLPQFSLVGE